MCSLNLNYSLIPGHFAWDYGGKSGILMLFSLSTSVFFMSVLLHQCPKLLGLITGYLWGEEFGQEGGMCLLSKCAFQV